MKISVKNSELSLLGGQKEILFLRQSLGPLPKRWLMTSEQRIIFVTAQLLLAMEPYKSTFFSYQLNVVEGTVSMYMDKIQHWLAEKNFSLSRKRRYGIQIEGSEWNKRNALVSLVYEYKPVEGLLPFFYGTKEEPVIHSFFNFLFGDRVLQMSKGVLELIPDYQADDDVSYLTSLLHIAISFKKAMENHPILLPDDFIREAISGENFEFSGKLRDYLSDLNLKIAESESHIFVFTFLENIETAKTKN